MNYSGFTWDVRSIADRKQMYQILLKGRRPRRLHDDPKKGGSIRQWANSERRMTMNEAYLAAAAHFGPVAHVYDRSDHSNPYAKCRYEVFPTVLMFGPDPQDVRAIGETWEEALLRSGVPSDPDSVFPLMRCVAPPSDLS